MSETRHASKDSSRHPIRALEHLDEHLNEIADEGESGATPAILVGREIRYLVPLVALVIALALAAAYLATQVT